MRKGVRTEMLELSREKEKKRGCWGEETIELRNCVRAGLKFLLLCS
jgi:hypothetical protein